MRINNFVLDFGEDSLLGKRVLSSEASRGCTWTGLQLKVKKAAERRLMQQARSTSLVRVSYNSKSI